MLYGFDLPAHHDHPTAIRQVAAATQNQALNALLFLSREVLNIDLGNVSQFMRAKCPKRLPTVLTKEEVQSVIQHLQKQRSRLIWTTWV